MTNSEQSSPSAQAPLSCAHWAQLLQQVESAIRRRRVAMLTRILKQLSPENMVLLTSTLSGEFMRALRTDLFELEPHALQTYLTQQLGEARLAAALKEAARPSDLFRLLPPLEGPPSPLTLLEVRSLAESVLRFQLSSHHFLGQLFQQQSPDTCVRLCALLHGEPPLAFGQELLLEALSQATGVEYDALRASYALTRDLEDTTLRAQKGRRAVAQVHCRTGRPFAFMRRQPLQSFETVLGNNSPLLLVDEEPLGIRVQIHRRHVLVHLYSDKGHDISRAFPEVTAALEKALTGTDDLILEGVVFGVEGAASTLRHALQERLLQLPRRRGEPLKPAHKFQVVVSELLRQGREDLMPRPALERRTRARQLLRTVEGVKVLETVPASTLLEHPQSHKALTSALMSGTASHTWVAYAPTSVYVPGEVGAGFQLTLRHHLLLLTGVEVESAGQLPRLQLACLHEGMVVPVGHARLSKHAALESLLQLLLKRYTVLEKDGVHLLCSGLVVEARSMRLRKASRRPAGVGMDGLEVHGIRLELGEEHVVSRDALIQLAEAMEKLELPPAAYASSASLSAAQASEN